MLDAGKTFFFSGGNNLTISQKSSGGIMVKERETQNIH